MRLRDAFLAIGICIAVQVPITFVVVANARPAAPVQAPAPPPVDHPKAPPTEPNWWAAVPGDTDRVPVQVVTMPDGRAFFVVGTDTAHWPPLVWIFDPASQKWERQ